MGPRWDGNGTISTASSSTRRLREKSTNSSGRGARGLRRISFRRRIKELWAIQRKKVRAASSEWIREKKKETDWLWSRLWQFPASYLRPPYFSDGSLSHLSHSLTIWNQDRLLKILLLFSIIITRHASTSYKS